MSKNVLSFGGTTEGPLAPRSSVSGGRPTLQTCRPSSGWRLQSRNEQRWRAPRLQAVRKTMSRSMGVYRLRETHHAASARPARVKALPSARDDSANARHLPLTLDHVPTTTDHQQAHRALLAHATQASRRPSRGLPGPGQASGSGRAERPRFAGPSRLFWRATLPPGRLLHLGRTYPTDTLDGARLIDAEKPLQPIRSLGCCRPVGNDSQRAQRELAPAWRAGRARPADVLHADL